VESLLRFDSGSAHLPTGVVGATVERFLDSSPDSFCGPYELMRLLGEGGMGSVHLAQRKDGEVDLCVFLRLSFAVFDAYDGNFLTAVALASHLRKTYFDLIASFSASGGCCPVLRSCLVI
jgi:serine/threonine protein kinase